MSTHGDIDIAELRRLAEAATPGPWEAPLLWDESGLTDNRVQHAPGAGQCWKTDTATIAAMPAAKSDRANAEYIAAANPQVMLALLARLEAAERRIRVLEGEEDHEREAVRLNNIAHRRRFEACRPTSLARGLKVREDHESSPDGEPLELLVAEEIDAALAARGVR